MSEDSGAAVAFRLNDRELKRRAKEFGANLAGANTQTLMDQIAAYGLLATDRRFEKGEGPGGERWPMSMRAKLQGGQTLVDSARLRQSFGAEVTATMAQWGTNTIYAAIHQFGGRTAPHVIEAVHAKALNIPGIGFRKRVSHPGSDIPARPFLGIDEADEVEIAAIADDWLRGLIPA
jgi:phage virion morphogenesis protein